ncbi:ferritin family protein [candidate division WOR-3 bacterium]|nr:ferritin family protein [candidate division WOR-3 bacterium]
MKIFQASEIFQFAIRIEENGEKFYREISKIIKDKEIKSVLNYLADEEAKHRKLFGDMVSKIEKYEPPESYPGEYFAYLRAYVDNIIFTNEMLNKEISQIKDTVSAMNFAIQMELDSILYYEEVKKFVSESQHISINKIIDEERKHFLKLVELKKSCV